MLHILRDQQKLMLRLESNKQHTFSLKLELGPFP